jgi:hypothetical protein
MRFVRIVGVFVSAYKLARGNNYGVREAYRFARLAVYESR